MASRIDSSSPPTAICSHGSIGIRQEGSDRLRRAEQQVGREVIFG